MNFISHIFRQLCVDKKVWVTLTPPPQSPEILESPVWVGLKAPSSNIQIKSKRWLIAQKKEYIVIPRVYVDLSRTNLRHRISVDWNG